MPTCTVDGADLAYEERGAGTPVLLLHGLGANLTSWEAQVAALAPRHRVIAMDLRGSGRSRDRAHPQGPFSIPQFAADARALLDRLGAAPAHVVGLSLGGMIAFQLAVDAPAHCRSLTIVNSGPAVVPRNALERSALGLRRIVTSLVGPATFARLLAPRLFPRPGQAALRARFIAMVAANDPRAYVATLDAILGWSVLDRLGAVTAPTLVVAADHDYTSVASKEAWVRCLPRARLIVVEDARHALPMEAPERFNPVLTDFLASLESGGHAA